MSAAIIWVSGLTILIHLVGTLSLAVRVVGLRTGKWAMSYALFNIMSLVARLATTLQAPLLAKTVETQIRLGQLDHRLDFHWVILASTIGTGLAGLLFPSFHRLLARMVEGYYRVQSIPKLLWQGLYWQSLRQIPAELAWPKRANWWVLIGSQMPVPISVWLLNMLTNAILTAGVLASLYAGYLTPELRATAASMSGFVNGAATILSLVFVDPQIALLSDEVNNGRHSSGYFRRYIIGILIARLVGTVLAQALLQPMAMMISWLAVELGV